MTTDELLRQILADPTDAALRSVYADALLAAGDPRGELIAVESALDRPGARERRLELRAQHAQTWWGRPAHQVRSERGFAVGVATSWAELQENSEILEREPIEEIELTRHHDEGLLPIRFLRAPWFRRLTVRGHFASAAGLSVRMRPLTDRLESLDITGSMVSSIHPLEELSNLRRLVVARNPLGNTLITLLRWSHLGQLDELDARSCDIDARTLDELLGLDLQSLRVLKLSGNPLGDRGTAVLQRRLRNLPKLERLELVDCDVTDITHAAITEREDLPAIIDLLGTTLELVPTLPGRYQVLVDGMHRAIRYRSLRSTDGEPATLVESSEGLDAPLEPLYRAIALGVLRTLDATGAIVQLGRDVAFAYARAITTNETVTIRLGNPLDIEFERHIENDD